MDGVFWPQDLEENWGLMAPQDFDYATQHIDLPEPCAWCGVRQSHSKDCVSLCDEWDPKMPFGKHKGTKMSAMPPDYLAWMLGKGIFLNSDLRQAAERAIRKAAPDLAKTVLDRGYIPELEE